MAVYLAYCSHNMGFGWRHPCYYGGPATPASRVETPLRQANVGAGWNFEVGGGWGFLRDRKQFRLLYTITVLNWGKAGPDSSGIPKALPSSPDTLTSICCLAVGLCGASLVRWLRLELASRDI